MGWDFLLSALHELQMAYAIRNHCRHPNLYKKTHLKKLFELFVR